MPKPAVPVPAAQVVVTATPVAAAPVVAEVPTALPQSAIEMVALLDDTASATTTASFEGAPTSEVDYDELFANIEAQLMTFS